MALFSFLKCFDASTFELQYPHVFEDDVLANLRGWVMEEIPRSSGDERHWKPDTGKKRTSDFEILRTYSTALLAVCLSW